MGRPGILHLLTISASLLMSASLASADPRADVEEILASATHAPADLNSRMEWVSRSFLGKPYLLDGPLGEGADGKYDQDPLYRLDGFDCTTFIETSYALTRAQNFDDFLSKLLKMRYHHGDVSFTSRNHFVELDWNPNNIEAGFFTDDTLKVGDESDHAIAVQIFSKRKWYAEMTLDHLKLPDASTSMLQTRLRELQDEGKRFEDVESRLPYLKKTSLLKLKETLPLPAVLNIIRRLSESSNLNATTAVTHQVLLLEINGTLQIRQASSKTAYLRVLDLPFEPYVQSLIESPSTLGVQVLKVLP